MWIRFKFQKSTDEAEICMGITLINGKVIHVNMITNDKNDLQEKNEGEQLL